MDLSSYRPEYHRWNLRSLDDGCLRARGSATQFLAPTPETTLTIPSTAAKVISVGAYDSNTNTYAPFSGRGFTWNTNQVKPDIVAPGVGITSCAVGGGYETRSGTSMATPFVSGSCALLMQWGILMGNDSFLYGEKMKAYLIKGPGNFPLQRTIRTPVWGGVPYAYPQASRFYSVYSSFMNLS